MRCCPKPQETLRDPQRSGKQSGAFGIYKIVLIRESKSDINILTKATYCETQFLSLNHFLAGLKKISIRK